MKIGVVFPQTEIWQESQFIREFAKTAEDLGFHHVSAYDHVLGVHPEFQNWEGIYDSEDPFREPLTMFAYMAGMTSKIRLITRVLVLPQRQTAVVAKQAAEVDILSDGRLRLGVGVGWNEHEYAALGRDFTTRGHRIEEQIQVMRNLWCNDVIDYTGEFHELERVGINPRPVQQPIPVWLGGTAEPVLKRVGRIGDGWLPRFDPGPEAERQLQRVYSYAEDAGRNPDELTIFGRTGLDPEDRSNWSRIVDDWEALDVDLLGINPIGFGLDQDEHIQHLKRIAEELPL